MNRQEALKIIREIMLDLFVDSELPESIDDLKMGDVDDWDSLGNFNLILECENKFNVRFPVEAISDWNSVNKILNYVTQ
jgi:acyl carrier protein